MKKSLLIISILLLIISCSENNEIIKKVPFVNKKKSIHVYEGNVIHTLQDNGNKMDIIKSIEFHRKGRFLKKSETYYKNGLEHGPYTEWESIWDNEKDEYLNMKILVKNYKDGKLDELLTKWNEKGQKIEEINYVYGELHGLSTTFFFDGKIEEQKNYRNDKLDGSFSLWGKTNVYFMDDSTEDFIYDSTGRAILDTTLYTKIEEGNYLRGEKTGQWNEWYLNGQKKKQYNHKIGNFTSDGKRTKTIWSFKVGPYDEWYPDGKNKVMGIYDSTWVSFSQPHWGNDEWSISSKRIDNWTEWYDNGNRILVNKYKDREIIHSQTFYENGMKKSETDYDKEGKVISRTQWNEDGSKIK
jgi:antitoxin component YwqK of YwqJK toxin-antitoxin module